MSSKVFTDHDEHLSKRKEDHTKYEKIITRLANSDKFRLEKRLYLSLNKLHGTLIRRECDRCRIDSVYLREMAVRDIGLFVDMITAKRVQALLDSPENLDSLICSSYVSQPPQEEQTAGLRIVA